MTGRRLITAAMVITAASLGSCADDETAATSTVPPTTTTTTSLATTAAAGIPTPEELARWLVTPADLGGAWAVSTESFPAGTAPGVVTDELREELPTLEMCPEAGTEAATAAADVEWRAFTILERPGESPGRPIILGEFFSTGEPGDLQAMFDLLKAGTGACAGVDEATGEVGELIALPELGDDRFGALITTDPASGAPGSTFWGAFVRKGPTFMFLDLWEVSSGPAATTAEEFHALVTMAVSRIP